jgi:hypothetical protein
MKKLALLFSHNLTDEQHIDIKKSLKVNTIYNLPSNLQKMWSQVPTDRDLIFSDYLKDIERFLLTNLDSGDFVLIQGDFGATYYMINFCKLHSFIPIYSVNKRVSKEFIEDR